jgi:hypothetical protein
MSLSQAKVLRISETATGGLSANATIDIPAKVRCKWPAYHPDKQATSMLWASKRPRNRRLLPKDRQQAAKDKTWLLIIPVAAPTRRSSCQRKIEPSHALLAGSRPQHGATSTADPAIAAIPTRRRSGLPGRLFSRHERALASPMTELRVQRLAAFAATSVLRCQLPAIEPRTAQPLHVASGSETGEGCAALVSAFHLGRQLSRFQ